MHSDLHIRARALICEAALGTLGVDDERWLRDHLDRCPDCTAQHLRTQEAVEAVRSTPIMAPPVLVARTRAVVRSRSRELQESAAHTRMLVIACVLAFASTLVSIPMVWSLFGYFTGATAITGSGLTWMATAAWLWLMPALFGSAALLINRNGHQIAWMAQKGQTRD